MAAAQSLTVAAIYERHQEMWDSVYMTPESSDIAIALIRHKVLDIRRQNSKAVQRISLAKPTAFLACKENLGKMKEKLAALEALQHLEDSE
jgi:hypothetical protein